MSESPLKKSKVVENGLQQLANFTTIVADTGDFSKIKQYNPQDATTNPSLILKAAEIPDYQYLIDDAIKYAKEKETNHQSILNLALDKISVNFANEILKIVPGYVSIEVDARLSFNKNETLERARRIIALCEEMGISRDRVLIKIASTYEGILAGGILEKEGIKCNLTLLFSLAQAALCAENGITLISPFVGRILDWYKAKTGNSYESSNDPGVISVREIYRYFKAFNYSTIVMGASFRNIGEILELSGCDRLTISPNLLEELKNLSDVTIDRKLNPTDIKEGEFKKLDVSEESFRFLLNENAMATEKLSEGIRAFVVDIKKLESIIADKIKA